MPVDVFEKSRKACLKVYELDPAQFLSATKMINKNHTTKWFTQNLLAIEMKKTKVKINKPVYLGLSILEISKTLMYEFWCDYIKRKYSDTVKLCHMDTDSFILRIKTEDFYKNIANDEEK